MRVALSLAASQEGMNLKEFFSMYASQYLQVLNISMAPMMLTIDTHAPNYLRVNVICQMMPEYAETYGVTEGDGMYVKPEDRLIVWGK
jgi:putative endopeptidase